ncbi:[protein-PII] uridylyltransferase [Sphingobium sp. B2D3A]|uniref:[protein-PII] uridylyltransferase n=1 Tax=unclassified Sphingobium TaxID=2611147 RepID=UPI0022242586|nr:MULTISPECIES: [protein-PII] uridylyltransferase [unclassified Sphingobium]MCW2336030.1 [protein-PII] uridylyltransferase [Sphingobium sp. B2D3A]MCW2351661.1 [protein-PII] uridylyltransferase [Sphingobium sp. B12D2B]MCW2365011.1 [protein-PII] uridylyltransferase [Sphingobium sp. B7D2B]MCW2385789.1 [protein-PII] uridylyltransferase [Sphingobium sp. B2D3D]MCW2395842.1 [protein-PII] uridylyltransferase [Sphingobium sp. B8D3B]
MAPMNKVPDSLPGRRAIIDRRQIADALTAQLTELSDTAARRQVIVAALREALAIGREEVSRRLARNPTRGRDAVTAQAFLMDQIIRLLFDATVKHLYPISNRTASERLTVVAVGGYGRGEMAPYSDVDIGFLTPYKPTEWTEQVIESMLYALWDLGLKVGHSSRSIDETVRMAKSDLTIRTALLESRFVWGDRGIYDECVARFDKDVMQGTAKTFVTEKLAERDARHKQMGDSRYVVEPNIKEGKGGLRDLHTLFWIGKYVNRVRTVAELVDVGLLTRAELSQFQRAENFLWAVRCHMHEISRRAEDRLTFDLQIEVAERMGFSPKRGRSAVERFMHLYFLMAKTVGDLTGVFLAHLDDKMASRGRRYIPAMFNRPRKLDGFVLERGRITIPEDDFFREQPVRMIEIFSLADKHGLEIHPDAMRALNRDSVLITRKEREDPQANALFMNVLTSPRDPEKVLRWMNEAGVFGRFVPDFGRVVAQMQFDMYHHYTVDEHTIRAIGLLSQIEKGEFKVDHPLASAIIEKIISRRVLYVAVLLHDIAKGRGGDHSILGAEVATKLCPRLGLSDAETETVAWLVRYHLLMSATAFKRDLSDFKTILDFAEVVQSPERLRLLVILTIVDIRAVGPGVWNSWKRQLLAELYDSAEEVIRPGHKQRGRQERIEEKRDALRASLALDDKAFDRLVKRFPQSYWIAESQDILERNARHLLDAGQSDLSIDARSYPERGATLVTVYASDHPGLFYRIAGAIHLAGGNIIDARIHTLKDGTALDNFLVQDPLGGRFDAPEQLQRVKTYIEDALLNRHKLMHKLDERPLARRRAEAFQIVPQVLIDNKASNRFTVVEVMARDRPALLLSLAFALFQSKTMVHSAHVATFGERAVDTFYLTDLLGGKLESKTRLATLERRLIEAAGNQAGELIDTNSFAMAN